MPEIDWKKEMEKCKASPYYYFTTYWIVDGKPGVTPLSEEEFNEEYREMERRIEYLRLKPRKYGYPHRST